EYEQGFSVAETFGNNTTGIVTMGDSFIINESKEVLEKRLSEFLQVDETEDQIKQEYSLGKNYAKWIIENKSKIKLDDSLFVKLSYRPFDSRYTYFDNKLVWRPRMNTMKHFLAGENVGLCLTRQFKTGENYQHVLVNNNITESSYISNRTSEIGSTFPLWLYDEQGNKSSNLNDEIVKAIKLKAPNCDEQDIFDYIYGVLHWPAYRTKYKEFLKIDFPRVPYPKNQAEFDKFKLVGERLRQLHLMLAPDVDDYITSFPEPGTNQVVKLKYVCHPELDSGSPTKDSTGRVYINETQYFGGVPETAWNFYIGGYQPAQKWLKDRKGRELGFEDIMHYQRIIKVLDETGKVMEGV
ncbi:MAG: type ISP restriction/modification enzyme, partial [Candidatus Saccharimonadales bacterium]